MPVLFERSPPTKEQLRAVFAHIRRRREKEKAEEEDKRAKEEEEKKKKDEEARKRKEELEGVAKQIAALEAKLVSLRAEKHQLFAQLKKVLLQKQEDENRKRPQFATAPYNPAEPHMTGPKGFGLGVPPSAGGPGPTALPGMTAMSEDYQYHAGPGPGSTKHPISPASHNMAAMSNPPGQSQHQPGHYQGYSSAQYPPYQQGQSSSGHLQTEGHHGASRHQVPPVGATSSVTTPHGHQTGSTSYYPGPKAPGHGSTVQEPFDRPQVPQPAGQQGSSQVTSQGGAHDPDQTHTHSRQGSQSTGSHSSQGPNQGSHSSTVEQSHPPYGRVLSKTSGQPQTPVHQQFGYQSSSQPQPQQGFIDRQGYGMQPMQGQQHLHSRPQSYQDTQLPQGQQLQPEYQEEQYSHGSHMQHQSKHQQTHGQDHQPYHPHEKQPAQAFQSPQHMQQPGYSAVHSQSQSFSLEQQRQMPQAQNYQSQHGYQVQQDQIPQQQTCQQMQQSYPHASQQRSQQQSTPVQGQQSQYDQKLHQQSMPPPTPQPGNKQDAAHSGQAQGQPASYSSQYMVHRGDWEDSPTETPEMKFVWFGSKPIFQKK